MYYKVMKNGRAIDALDRLCFVRYQSKNNVMVNCTEEDSQGIISSDGRYIWHVEGFPLIPCPGYDTVELVETDVYEYNQIKALNGSSPEEIIDNYTLSLILGGVL